MALSLAVSSAIMLSVVFFYYCYAGCHYAECHYAECRCAKNTHQNLKLRSS
jgi:hypothetical protein